MRKLLFYTSLIVITISLFALTIGQWLQVDFANDKVESCFYIGLFFALPTAVLLTLVSTLKQSNSKSKNVGIIIITFVSAILGFCFVFYCFMNFKWGGWVSYAVAYRNINNPEHKVSEQRFNNGCIYPERYRVAEFTPLTPLFYIVSEVDTTDIDKTKWKRVDEEGDIKWP